MKRQTVKTTGALTREQMAADETWHGLPVLARRKHMGGAMLVFDIDAITEGDVLTPTGHAAILTRIETMHRLLG